MSKNRPTKSMQNAAKEGLQKITAGNFPVTPKAMDVGKKIASGQELSDEHVDDMAHYHASHDVCPKDAEDLLWGGPAGEHWARGKRIQAMSTSLADEDIDFNKIRSEKDINLSLEIWADKLDEPIEESDGLVWAPIARSGMLATRPGPNGEKLDEPLVFIPGHSEDQRKEIGMQDIYDAFKDKAIEYVTIPTSHENNVLENTGYIEDMKIVDSKQTPGEKVLLGGHKFTEPEIGGKVQRGSIPSRSCGLLYDYKNTTTGKVYPIALDHVCLTPKPWMGGMAPYGSEDFSDSTIVPMMLSERPVESEEIEPTQPTKLAQETVKPDQPNSDTQTEREFLADVQWGDSPSYHDIEKQIGMLLSGFGSEIDTYPYYYLLDCTGDKALIKVDYGVGPDNDAWVAPYSVQDGKVQLSPFSDWTDVTKKWVSDSLDPKQDKEQLDKLKMSDTNLAVLSSKARSKLPDSAFVYPSEKRYPIHDIEHGRNALVRVAQNGTPEEQAKVKAAVYRRYPELKKSSSSNSSNMSDPLKIASAKRMEGINKSAPGGPMLLAMSEEQMETLGLSDEAKEIQRKQNEEIAKLNDRVVLSEKKEKEARVSSKLSEYKEEGFDAFPGLLAEYEKTALSDDGDIAVKLHLSESGHNVEVPETATEMAERFMKAIPRKDGKVDLGEFANKLETPAIDRPADKPEDTTEDKKPVTGADLLSQWAKDDPSLAKEPMVLAMSENGKGN